MTMDLYVHVTGEEKMKEIDDKDKKLCYIFMRESKRSSEVCHENWRKQDSY